MSYTSLLYHVVFSTKERRPWLSEDVLSRVCEYAGGILRELGGKMIAAGGAKEHVHIALSGSKAAVPDILRTIKTNTSRWVHRTFAQMRAFAWQDGYAAFTVSKSVLPTVVRYIENQQRHHRSRTFEEEYLELLRRHGIEYDPRHVWA
jgi:REP element-mobilizing transposase RayT